MSKKRGNLGIRGQVTIWIIVAIILVAVIVLLFALRVPQRLFLPSTPNAQLGDCIDDKLNDAVNVISAKGGSANPVNALMYQGEKIEYLCYTNQYYQTCANQQPLLKQHIEREILEYINDDAVKCVQNLKQDLIKKGYSVSEGKTDINVNILPNNVKVIVSGFSAVSEEQGVRYSNFEASRKSELYDFVMLTNSILNWEARYGDSDITTYMFYYPNMKLEKYKQGDGSKMYILTDRQSKDKFAFATRSLSWPAGYGYGQTFNPVGV